MAHIDRHVALHCMTNMYTLHTKWRSRQGDDERGMYTNIYTPTSAANFGHSRVEKSKSKIGRRSPAMQGFCPRDRTQGSRHFPTLAQPGTAWGARQILGLPLPFSGERRGPDGRDPLMGQAPWAGESQERTPHGRGSDDRPDTIFGQCVH